MMAVSELFELFFDLPSELREQILGYLLIKPEAIMIKHGSDRMGLDPSTGYRKMLSSDSDTDDEHYSEEEAYGSSWPLNYFLVSQAFHREATVLYFRDNVFHIFPRGTKMPPLQQRPGILTGHSPGFMALTFKDARSGDALLLNPAWMPSVRRIRNVVIYIHRLRDFLEKSVFQPLQAMILAGGLKSLEFRMGVRSRGESMFSAGPMRCMYRVLTDPDLRVARLSIPAQSHARIWCPFHAGGGLGLEGCDVSRGRVDGPRSDWLGVDVAALIRKYGEADDYLRILKVGD